MKTRTTPAHGTPCPGWSLQDGHHVQGENGGVTNNSVIHVSRTDGSTWHLQQKNCLDAHILWKSRLACSLFELPTAHSPSAEASRLAALCNPGTYRTSRCGPRRCPLGHRGRLGNVPWPRGVELPLPAALEVDMHPVPRARVRFTFWRIASACDSTVPHYRAAVEVRYAGRLIRDARDPAAGPGFRIPTEFCAFEFTWPIAHPGHAIIRRHRVEAVAAAAEQLTTAVRTLLDVAA